MKNSTNTPLNLARLPFEADEKIDFVGSIPFFLVHLACLAVFWVGVSPIALAVCAISLFIRMFGVTAGYHRYFSHRAFQTSRFFQFVLGFLGAAATQMGPLWWANHHRTHHRFADKEGDIHSPGLKGFFWAHIGWVLCRKNYTDKEKASVNDLKKFPELRFLDDYFLIAPISLATLIFLIGLGLERLVPGLHTNGWQMLVWGFFISTVLLYHITFSVNSLAHTVGNQRFNTHDTSRNNFFVALITMGEGWHNNHHRYPSSARQGFYWWEIDMTHYVLTVLSWLGIVSDLRSPTPEVYEEARLTA